MHDQSVFDGILHKHLPLCDGDIPRDAPLADLGLDSLATVSLVMELEENMEIAIPDDLLIPETFATAAALWDAISNLPTTTAG